MKYYSYFVKSLCKVTQGCNFEELTIEMPLCHWCNCNATVNTPLSTQLKLTTVLKKCYLNKDVLGCGYALRYDY